MKYDIKAELLYKLIEKQKEYQKLLIEELDESVSIAWVHGWRSTKAKVGERLRDEIASLESDLAKDGLEDAGVFAIDESGPINIEEPEGVTLDSVSVHEVDKNGNKISSNLIDGNHSEGWQKSCGDSEYGKCDICGKDAFITRTYYHYPIKCECHSPFHFELICHCPDCIPAEPKFTKVLIKPNESKIEEPEGVTADVETVLFDVMTDNNFTYVSFPAFVENESSVDVFDIVCKAMERIASSKQIDKRKFLKDFNSYMLKNQYDGRIPLIDTCITEYLNNK